MAEAGTPTIVAQVVYALPGQAYLCRACVPLGGTVRAAIEASGILEVLPELRGRDLDVGIFGRSCTLDEAVRDGDRVEIYRPLQADPKDARRQRASSAR